jgi:motility quorum-sensing regulator / GCU-specific mRNA interferase toxin
MMEGKPTYDLRQLQQLVGQGELSCTITQAAKAGGALLGLDEEEIVESVLLLAPRHFYKSMESDKVPGLWQDVYHLQFRGQWLYIKLQLGTNGRAVIVQHKAR